MLVLVSCVVMTGILLVSVAAATCTVLMEGTGILEVLQTDPG